MNYIISGMDNQLKNHDLVPELPLFDRVPEKLKEYQNWVCWKYVVRPTHVSCLQIFPEPADLRSALDICKEKDYGLGYKLSKNDPFSAVIISKCFDENGKITADAESMVKIANTYTEIDDHMEEIYIVGNTKTEWATCKGNVKIVSDRVIIPIAGHTCSFFPDVMECPREFARIASRYCAINWMDEVRALDGQGDELSILSSVLDECLNTANWLENADRTDLYEFMARCRQYRRLRNQINFHQEWKYRSKSVKDDFFAECDATADVLGLIRKEENAPKKERKKKDRAPELVPVDILSIDGKSTHSEELPLSDYTNALAFVKDHGLNLHYCYPWKKFLVWNGTHWKDDDSGMVPRMAKQTIKRMGSRLEDAENEVEFLRHIKSSLKQSNLQAMVACAQSEDGIPILPDDFDADPWLLNCLNGVIDLRTGDLRPHDRNDLITHCLNIEYDPDAVCPTWEAFLWRIMGGSITPDSPDDSASTLEEKATADKRAKELTDFLQDAIGYSLTGDTSEECFFILYGSGQNGKSKLIGALQDLLSSYSQSTHSKTFMVTDRSDAIPNDIARLRGSRMVVASELGKDRRLNEELVKRATGRDPMTARFLHSEFFDFIPQFKLFLVTNHLPKITSVDKSMWRRIHQIPFTVTIPEDEKDPRIGDKLRAELQGILAWAVRGCLRWQKKGLRVPAAVVEATQGYRSDMDTIGRFIGECCMIGDPRYRAKASELYRAYDTWCSDSNERAESQTVFGRYLTENGFDPKKDGIVWRIGIGLKASEKTSEK